jgi:thymidylate synthase (FAD)
MTAKKILDPLNDTISELELMYTSDIGMLQSIVNAARVSYDKDNKESDIDKDQKLVNFLYKNEHTSPFRHFYLTFRMTIPIFVARQWMKYQVGSTWRSFEIDDQEIEINMFDHLYDEDKGCSWNELSGRYAVMEDKFWVPQEARVNAPSGNKQKSIPTDNHSLNKNFQDICKFTYDFAYSKYKYAISMGIAKELARVILPSAMYTKVYWTVSLQSFMHFLNQRLKDDAQKEIRDYATAAKEITEDIFKEAGINY